MEILCILSRTKLNLAVDELQYYISKIIYTYQIVSFYCCGEAIPNKATPLMGHYLWDRILRVTFKTSNTEAVAPKCSVNKGVLRNFAKFTGVFL